jgi:hypothetical protein
MLQRLADPWAPTGSGVVFAEGALLQAHGGGDSA